MKKYIEIEKELQEVKENIRKIKETTQKDYNKLTDLRIKREALINNAKITLFEEYIPMILEVLNKYKNKFYGEKTAEGIKSDIEKFGIYFYIRRQKGRGFLYFRHKDYDTSAEVYLHGRNILENNKIMTIEKEDLKIYNVKNYIEDLDEYVSELKEKYKMAYEKHLEFKNVCEDFNDLTVGNIKMIYPGDYIYERLTI